MSIFKESLIYDSSQFMRTEHKHQICCHAITLWLDCLVGNGSYGLCSAGFEKDWGKMSARAKFEKMSADNGKSVI